MKNASRWWVLDLSRNGFKEGWNPDRYLDFYDYPLKILSDTSDETYDFYCVTTQQGKFNIYIGRVSRTVK